MDVQSNEVLELGKNFCLLDINSNKEVINTLRYNEVKSKISHFIEKNRISNISTNELFNNFFHRYSYFTLVSNFRASQMLFNEQEVVEFLKEIKDKLSKI